MTVVRKQRSELSSLRLSRLGLTHSSAHPHSLSLSLFNFNIMLSLFSFFSLTSPALPQSVFLAKEAHTDSVSIPTTVCPQLCFSLLSIRTQALFITYPSFDLSGKTSRHLGQCSVAWVFIEIQRNCLRRLTELCCCQLIRPKVMKVIHITAHRLMMLFSHATQLEKAFLFLSVTDAGEISG